MKNDDIFERLTEHGQSPVPPRPAHLRPSLRQLRADIAATPRAERDEAIELAQDVHHEHLLARWAEEHLAELRGQDLDEAWRKFATQAAEEEVAEDEAAWERARNRRSTGTGPIAILSGDDETPEHERPPSTEVDLTSEEPPSRAFSRVRHENEIWTDVSHTDSDEAEEAPLLEWLYFGLILACILATIGVSLLLSSLAGFSDQTGWIAVAALPFYFLLHSGATLSLFFISSIDSQRHRSATHCRTSLATRLLETVIHKRPRAPRRKAGD